MSTQVNHHSNSLKSGLRMKELVEATGLPKSTILYYIQQGILPEPIKTSPNMAYYDPKCIEYIQFIQQMQRRHRLSLSEIKQIMEKRGDDADYSTYLELRDLIFGPSQQEHFLNREEFCKATGLTADQVTGLLKARLLLPLEEDRFDQEDVSIGKMFAQAFSWGIRIEDLSYYVELGEKIVDHEVALKRHITHHLPYNEDAAVTLEMVKNARTSRTYIIDRLFQHRIASMKDLKDEE
jgi:DNA-binding transcriptional MerR regulator